MPISQPDGHDQEVSPLISSNIPGVTSSSVCSWLSLKAFLIHPKTFFATITLLSLMLPQITLSALSLGLLLFAAILFDRAVPFILAGISGNTNLSLLRRVDPSHPILLLVASRSQLKLQASKVLLLVIGHLDYAVSWLAVPDSKQLTAKVGPKTLTEFTIFPNLPPELRQIIWGLASNHPRLILVSPIMSVVGNKPPVVLQVNSESRATALRHYILGAIKEYQTLTFLNPEVDIIYIMSAEKPTLPGPHQHNRNAWSTQWMANGWLKAVKRIAFSINAVSYNQYQGIDGWNRYDAHQSIGVITERLGPLTKNLQELILVDTFHAPPAGFYQYLVSLKSIDMIQLYKDGSVVPRQSIRIHNYLNFIKEHLRLFKNTLKEEAKRSASNNSTDWIDNFTPDIRIMQLRNPYAGGVEMKGNGEHFIHQYNVYEFGIQIVLGKLRKVNGVWDIIKR